MVAILLFTTCTKTYMEKAQDGYSASDVVPVVLSISGPTSVLQTFSFSYNISYNRAGSTWNWTATDATIQTVSEDTKTVTVLFDTKPANGKALIKVTETTAGGTTSEEKVIEVTVNAFCALPVAGFVGSWGGTDGFGTGSHLLASQVVVSTPTTSSVKVYGLNFGWMAAKWGENIVDGGTIDMTINPNGTIVIPDQYFCTTDWDASVYWISGTGTWGNCGPKPAMILNYIVYYKVDGYTLPVDYAGAAYPTFVATLTLN